MLGTTADLAMSSLRSLGQSMASGVGEEGELVGRVTVLSSTAVYSVQVRLGSTTTPVCLCSCLKLRHCHVTLNVLIVSICRRKQPIESRFLFLLRTTSRLCIDSLGGGSLPKVSPVQFIGNKIYSQSIKIEVYVLWSNLLNFTQGQKVYLICSKPNKIKMVLFALNL